MLTYFLGLPWWLSGKECACSAGARGFNPWVRKIPWEKKKGRSPGGGHGNPLQCFCLENPMDRGVWQATVPGVAKSQTWPKQLSMHTLIFYSPIKMQVPRRWKLYYFFCASILSASLVHNSCSINTFWSVEWMSSCCLLSPYIFKYIELIINEIGKNWACLLEKIPGKIALNVPRNSSSPVTVAESESKVNKSDALKYLTSCFCQVVPKSIWVWGWKI